MIFVLQLLVVLDFLGCAHQVVSTLLSGVSVVLAEAAACQLAVPHSGSGLSCVIAQGVLLQFIGRLNSTLGIGCLAMKEKEMA